MRGIDDLTLGEIKQLTNLFGRGAMNDCPGPWKIGQVYFIRTVTHHLSGRLIEVWPNELVLEDAAWIADDGRYHQCIADGASAMLDIEPLPDGKTMVIGRGALIDAVPVAWDPPREVK
ncbi:MAG: hypothetical protein ABH877_03085 [bacterium]